MIRKVFETLIEDSRNGDFIYLTNLDRKELKIQLTNVEIQSLSKLQWKKVVREKTEIAALKYLTEENNKKDKTRDIKFNELKMSEYLLKNIKTSLSKTIFSEI